MGCKFRIEKRRDKPTGNIIEANGPSFADITLKGLRVTYSTGYRVDADKWLTIKDKNEATGEVADGRFTSIIMADIPTIGMCILSEK